MEEKQVYNVEGFTCANCAAKFESNVKALPGVLDAQVNFGASKLTVYGKATITELEKAGAFENLRLYHEDDKREREQVSLWKNAQFLRTAIGGFFMIVGYIFHFSYGEASIQSIIPFALSIAIGGYALFWQGVKNLIKLYFDMRTLMTIAIIGAAIIGEWGEGAVVVFLFAISEVLERYSMERARQSIRSLMEIAPRKALIRRDEQEMEVEVEQIRIGDFLIIKPGQKIAMDGVIVKGSSTINEAAITGESIPVYKREGAEVFQGTLNEEGFLEVEVTKHQKDTTLAKIIHLVEEAQAKKAPSQAFVDKFAKYYTPLIMLVALLVATIPPLFFGGEAETWIYQGLAVLVVGCPCALVVSTPVAIVTAIGNAARKGVLIKGGIYLEQIGEIDTIAFDKTGTLTKGIPTITDYDGNKHHLEIACALEKNSEHPIARAFIQLAEKVGVDGYRREVKQFTSITGKGVMGEVDGVIYYLASPKHFLEKNLPIPNHVQKYQQEGKTVVLLGTEEEVLASFAIRDEARESSMGVIKRLKELGMKKTVMLSGDNEQTAKAIGKELNLDEIEAELLPEEKLQAILRLQKNHRVAMVGDGINDAPALATAHIGIAMGGAGTDTALETADVALMGDDLTKLPFLIRLSRKTLTIIKQNISFALGLKLVALLLVIPGWLTLWIAIFADMGATLLVMFNGLRLLKVKEDA